jgi:hypothetical protein
MGDGDCVPYLLITVPCLEGDCYSVPCLCKLGDDAFPVTCFERLLVGERAPLLVGVGDCLLCPYRAGAACAFDGCFRAGERDV